MHIKANERVPRGIPDQEISGEILDPVQVYLAGISPSCWKLLLLIVIVFLFPTEPVCPIVMLNGHVMNRISHEALLEIERVMVSIFSDGL